MKVLNAVERYSTEDRYKRTIVYMWPKGETLLENLQNRRCRPIEQTRALLPQALRTAGFEPSLAASLARTAKWRQKAGCNCGCSPGFIIDHYSRNSIHVDYADDNYVTVDTDVVDAMAAG